MYLISERYHSHKNDFNEILNQITNSYSNIDIFEHHTWNVDVPRN